MAVNCPLVFGFLSLLFIVCVSGQQLERYDGKLCSEYNGTVKQLKTDVWFISNDYSSCFNSSNNTSSNKGLRVLLKSNSLVSTNNSSFPLVFVLRDEDNVQTWKLPLNVTGFSSTFNDTQQTVCSTLSNELPVAMYINVFTTSYESISYQLMVEPVDGFELELNSSIQFSVEPNSPQMYYFTFPDDVANVLISVDSLTVNNCAIVSVQKAACPVDLSVTSLKSNVIYQTMSNSSTILVQSETFKEFFVLVVLAPLSKCERGVVDDSEYFTSFEHNYTLVIKETYLATHYPFAISFPILVFVLIGLLSTLIFAISFCCPCTCVPCICCQKCCRKLYSDNEPSKPLLLPGIDAEGDRGLLDKNEGSLRVADVMKNSSDNLKKDYYGYFWNTITVGIFYGLPAFQLVLAKQLIQNTNGDEDICYYNFKCARKYDSLSAFNNNWSNVGYVILGIFFLIIVSIKHCVKRKHYDSEFGLLQFFGTYYAMGFALVAEGFMSAFYHICPSHFDFQFDTAFMFIISGLLIVKMVQARHPDLYSNAFIALLCLGVIVLLTFIGIYEESKDDAIRTLNTKIVLFFVFIVIIIAFCVSYYFYLGCHANLWLNKKLFGWCKSLCSPNKCNCKPRHWMRCVKVIFFLVVNIIIGIVFLIKENTGIATIVLALFITNLLLLIICYIISKFIYMEPWTFQPFLFLLLTVLLFAGAFIFYTSNVSQWEKTPAGSRDLNEDCKLLDFYDNHDIWHFLSAAAMFFAFLFLLTIDDGLIKVPRKDIHIF